MDVFLVPALPMIAMKNGQFGKGGSTCLWMGLSHRNSKALSWSLLDFSIRNILVLSLNIFQYISILLCRNSVRIYFENLGLFVRKSKVHCLVVYRGESLANCCRTEIYRHRKFHCLPTYKGVAEEHLHHRSI